jgi:hypothetical protein
MANDELDDYEIALRLRGLLISHATGGPSNESEYQQLRRQLLTCDTLKRHVPRELRVWRSLSEFWNFIQPEFPRYKERRAFLTNLFEPIFAHIEEPQSPVVDGVTDILAVVDWEHVHTAWRAALDRVEDDPEGAITAARSLLETVCKHILDEAAVAYDNKDDLPQLYRKTAEVLNLSPDGTSEQIFKQILGGCQTVVGGIAAIRNRLGDAHGKGRADLKPESRHAELAVNLGGSMSSFLIKSWEAREE